MEGSTWMKAGNPIFKKDKKEDPGNYRSVSLTDVPDKIMEKIMLWIIEKYMKENADIALNCSQPTQVHKKKMQFNLNSSYEKVTF